MRKKNTYSLIEQDIHIPLTKLFSALKYGIKYYTYLGIKTCERPSLCKSNMRGTYFNLNVPEGNLWVEDYGKTWVLITEYLPQEILDKDGK